MRHLGHRDDVAAGLLIGLCELRDAGGVGQNQVVRQQDGERIVTDEGTGAPDRVAEAERVLLAHRHHRPRLDLDCLEQGQRLALVPISQRRFELERNIEMFDDGGLAAAGDQAELVDPGGTRFLDRVLDQRLVDDRQHLLGHRLGGRQETRAEAGDRQNGLAKWFVQRSRSLRCMPDAVSRST